MKEFNLQQKIIAILLAVAFVGLGIFSFYSHKNLQGNARIVNYTGIVRGATQKLVKEELYGKHNDNLIHELDGILHELANGQGENDLIYMRDEKFQTLLKKLNAFWDDLKTEIVSVRGGAKTEDLFDMSEQYFDLADQTVSAAEVYSERQAQNARRWLLGLYVGLVILVAISVIYGSRQRKLREALLEAQSASREKGKFLSQMSHEIRTPMNGIIGMTEIAKLNVSDTGKIKECLAKIERSSKFLLELLNDILDMSRIESGKITLDNRPFRISEMIGGIYDMFALQAQEKQLKLEVSLQDMDCDLVAGDELRLRQILINLISNALKFTPKNGVVKVQVMEAKPQSDGMVFLRFLVRDNGIGMSEEFMGRMFEPFEQAEKTARDYGGTGLGLPISHKMVQLMGGTISARSKLNEGTEFTIDLGLEAAPDDKGVNQELILLQDSAARLSGKNVLLAEDNDINAEIVIELLRNVKAQTVHAWNGQEAFEIFVESRPGSFDFIIMDIQMPVMNGLEATEKIRQSQHPDAGSVPIIALTANAFNEDVDLARQSGMNNHLSKPINTEKFYQTLAAILE